jgi:hypothetical protein
MAEQSETTDVTAAIKRPAAPAELPAHSSEYDATCEHPFVFATENGSAIQINPDRELVTDFDGVLSVTGATGGKDPFESVIDPRAQEALQKLAENGKPVVVLTGRGGAAAARRIGAAGVNYIGTGGYELHKDGVSTVDSRFHAIAPEITSLLAAVRAESDRMTQAPIDAAADEQMVQTQHGPIALERKAMVKEAPSDSHPLFPEGLSNVYNLNQFDADQRETFVARVKAAYEQKLVELVEAKFPSASEGVVDAGETVQREADRLKYRESIVAGCSIKDQPSTFGRSIVFEPPSKIRKGQSMIGILRDSADEKRPDHLRNLPKIEHPVYLGDTDDDSWPMDAGNLARVTSQGKRDAFGIMVQSEHTLSSGARLPKVNSATLSGVSETAQFLQAWSQAPAPKAA